MMRQGAFLALCMLLLNAGAAIGVADEKAGGGDAKICAMAKRPSKCLELKQCNWCWTRNTTAVTEWPNGLPSGSAKGTGCYASYVSRMLPRAYFMCDKIQKLIPRNRAMGPGRFPNVDPRDFKDGVQGVLLSALRNNNNRGLKRAIVLGSEQPQEQQAQQEQEQQQQQQQQASVGDATCDGLDEGACVAPQCVWCTSAAVGGGCYTPEEAKQLPGAIFKCKTAPSTSSA